MTIKSLPPLQAPQPGSPAASRVDERQPASETQVKERKDTLELSSQAQEILDTQREESLQQIQVQVNSGFFNRSEVIRETAVKINNQLSSEVRKATS